MHVSFKLYSQGFIHKFMNFPPLNITNTQLFVIVIILSWTDNDLAPTPAQTHMKPAAHRNFPDSMLSFAWRRCAVKLRWKK